MKIGYVQTGPRFGAKEKNFEEVRKLLKGVRADLLVLPELFATGYTFTTVDEVRDLAETDHGLTAGFLKELSLITGAAMVGGFIEIEAGKLYNSSLIVSGDDVIDTYRKIHLFNKEKLWFSPGDKKLKVYEIKGFIIGVMICFDWMFPEVCRTLTLKGMQVLAHPSNLVLPYCQSAMITRCIENRVFAVTANRIGREKRGDDDFTFTGSSQITGVDGVVLASAPATKPHVSVIEIDEKRSDIKMINRYNDIIQDRQTTYYEV